MKADNSLKISRSVTFSEEMPVPFEYLREIAQASLPITVEEEASIDKLRVLRAAGLVAVMLPHPLSGILHARVLAITPRGRDLLTTQCEAPGPQSRAEA
ncbi:hypothetical protein [Acidovorax sp. 107]|uniref:hypothetical protein n=1 Tax=Acidovorax sp. 107 TaxID=2135638 RepID=UPI001E2FC093|nr:hypothetical protein [Acidovorax sp. 107]